MSISDISYFYGNKWANFDGCHDTLYIDHKNKQFIYTYTLDMRNSLHQYIHTTYVYYGSIEIDSELSCITFTFTKITHDNDTYSITPRKLITKYTIGIDCIEFQQSPRSLFWKNNPPTIYAFSIYNDDIMDENMDDYFMIPA